MLLLLFSSALLLSLLIVQRLSDILVLGQHDDHLLNEVGEMN
jgi:hypothetical protein